MSANCSFDRSAALREYAKRLELRRQALDRRAREDGRIAVARLAVVVAGIAVTVGAYRSGAVSPAVGFLFPPLFLALVVLHERVLQAKARAARAVRHVERGLARVEDRWRGTGTGGERFADESHPFAADLDLFGPGSIFELLCTARTREGEARLASYLTHAATSEVVRARQIAVRELAPQLDLREDVDVLAEHVAAHGDDTALLTWAAKDAALPSWVLPAAGALVAGSVSTLALAAGGLVDPLVAAGVLTGQSAFAALVRRRAAAALAGVDGAVEELKVLAGLLFRIEEAAFQAPLLASLQRRLRTDGEPPSRVVARLIAHVERLHQQQNQFFLPIAALLLWRTVHAALIARWRVWAGPRLADWIDAVAEIEALLALSAYAWEHPDDAEPEILDEAVPGAVVLVGEALGHPLLAGGGVRNDLSLGGAHPQLLVVSGSNMSGKSTFLRTVGVNVVLALAGGRVRARRLSLSPMALGCTLRVQDSLEKGASRFYAEILRLKTIMGLAADGPNRPLLFLLDELLAGTNSRDRQVGGAAILRGLVERGAVGLASTHDLALAAVADGLGDRAKNVHFEDVLDGQRVAFDYRLRDGVVERSNALALMRAVGLDV